MKNKSEDFILILKSKLHESGIWFSERESGTGEASTFSPRNLFCRSYKDKVSASPPPLPIKTESVWFCLALSKNFLGQIENNQLGIIGTRIFTCISFLWAESSAQLVHSVE